MQLLKVFQEVCGIGCTPAHAGHRYAALSCDVGIYWSLLKVLYTFPQCAPFRRDLFLCLGWWHPFMHALIQSWMNFFGPWLGQFWHFCFPDTKIFLRPKHRHLTTVFMWLHVCTEPILDALRETITALRDEHGSPRPIHGAEHALRELDNLETLLEYVIPVVSTKHSAT